MMMTPNKVVSAYKAVLEISKTVFPYVTSREVAGLLRKLKNETDVIANVERNLAEKHGGKVSPEGNVNFPDTKSVAEFSKERADYMSQEADISFQKVDISKYTEFLRVSPDTICALDGIIQFESEEDMSDG